MGGSTETTTKETKARICELYKSGLSIGAVAREVGTGQGLVQKVLEMAGVPTRTRSEGMTLWLQRERASGANRGNYETKEKLEAARKVLSL